MANQDLGRSPFLHEPNQPGQFTCCFLVARGENMKLYEGHIDTTRKSRIKIVSAESPEEAMEKLIEDCSRAESVMKIECEGTTLYELRMGGWKNRGF